MAAAVAMFVAMAVVLAPWTYRNYQVAGGRFVPLTPGASDSFLRGYVFTRWEFATLQKPPYTDAETEVNHWFRQIARDAGTVWEQDEVVDKENNARVAKTPDRDSAARRGREDGLVNTRPSGECWNRRSDLRRRERRRAFRENSIRARPRWRLR